MVAARQVVVARQAKVKVEATAAYAGHPKVQDHLGDVDDVK